MPAYRVRLDKITQSLDSFSNGTVVAQASVQTPAGGEYVYLFPLGQWIALPPDQPKPQIELDYRDMAKCLHAIDYAKNYSNAFVGGHSDLMLIAKLCAALGIGQPVLSEDSPF